MTIEEQVTPAAEHVEQAAEQVTEAAKQVTTDPVHEILVSVKDTLAGVQAELKRSNDRAEAATPKPAEAASAAVEPVVEVEKPETPVRHVRRNGRKVKR